MKEKLKTTISVPTSNLISNSEVIVTQSSLQSRRKDNQTVIEEKSEKSTTEIETETNESIHSKPQSLASIGVHDLYIGKDQFGKPMVPRKGKYAILKSDILSLEMKREEPRDAYDVTQPTIKQFIQYCEKSHEDDIKINPYPLLHQLTRGQFIVKN